MKNFAQKTENLANIAIIIVALLMGTVLVKKYLLPARPAVQPTLGVDIKPGEKVALQDVDWAQVNQTLLIVLSQDCNYCSESVPFYQQLIKQVNENPQSRIIAIFPQDPITGKRFLTDHGLLIKEVRQADLNALKARGTPTLILVDNQGIAKRVWIGKIPAQKESEIISELTVKTANNCCN